MIEFELNGRQVSVDAEPDTPLLWAIRDEIGLTGTKFGCGIGACGACTVHIDGTATRSCITYLSDVEGLKVTTIEGLDENGNHPVQEAWRNLRVPQCGYCQSGQIMSAAHLLQHNEAPSRDDIVAAVSGNLCRCGTYSRIVAAVESVVGDGAARPDRGEG